MGQERLSELFKKKFKSFRTVLIFMSIVGINYEKCSVCKRCITDCTRNLFKEDSSGKVIRLADKMKRCNFCGKYEEYSIYLQQFVLMLKNVLIS